MLLERPEGPPQLGARRVADPASDRLGLLEVGTHILIAAKRTS